mmetsp:Transcript_24578/g.24817  ORF Transcript_24578/g.24817 Transcript_24578/m.24817 type:complete len:418 (+) Transcript_24578:51-1304(+)
MHNILCISKRCKVYFSFSWIRPSGFSTFEKAAEYVYKLKSDPPADKKLELYALYKQSTVGPCEGSQPSLLDFVRRAKFDAWSSLGKISKNDAQQKYISLVKELSDSDQIEESSYSDSSENILYQQYKFKSLKDLIFSSKQSNTSNLSFKSIQTKSSQHIMHVILNRPEKRNAFDMQMWNDLYAVFQAVSNDEKVRVAILSGAGDHFSSGMDLSVFAELQKLGQQESCEARRREGLKNAIEFFQEAVSASEQCRVPVIAAISGYCVGGAVDVICACDMRYCTEDTRFSIKETDLAMVADIGTLQRLPHIIGDQQTRELAYTGRELTGKEAEKLGLVLKCFPSSADMWTYVNDIANQIAQKSPLTIRGVKKSIIYARDNPVCSGLDQVKMWNTAFLSSEDLAEAMKATMMKTTPHFKKG